VLLFIDRLPFHCSMIEVPPPMDATHGSCKVFHGAFTRTRDRLDRLISHLSSRRGQSRLIVDPVPMRWAAGGGGM
jgi:hypothetical protein